MLDNWTWIACVNDYQWYRNLSISMKIVGGVLCKWLLTHMHYTGNSSNYWEGCREPKWSIAQHWKLTGINHLDTHHNLWTNLLILIWRSLCLGVRGTCMTWLSDHSLKKACWPWLCVHCNIHEQTVGGCNRVQKGWVMCTECQTWLEWLEKQRKCRNWAVEKFDKNANIKSTAQAVDSTSFTWKRKVLLYVPQSAASGESFLGLQSTLHLLGTIIY